MIKIENVSFKYKDSDLILDNLSFNIYEGEIIAIVGQNGSGKSTLGKLISGILKLKNGNITIDNLNIKKIKDEKKIREKIGIVFQNPENQIIFNKIEDELGFALKDISKNDLDIRINKALEQVDMLDFKNRDLYSLSLGQKQRVMLAEILAKNPKYIVLDEPTTMIDSLGKEKIYEIIKNLKLQGYTIICITNFADEILLADRVLILDSGKIVSEIKKEELIEKIEEIEKYQIKVPNILKIFSELKHINTKLNIKEYTIEELISLLKEVVT